jgi:hypothetical protein
MWKLVLAFCPGLNKLEDLNLSFTSVTDNGLKRLSGLTNLKSLNLDARQITDAGLANLTSKHFLVCTHLYKPCLFSCVLTCYFSSVLLHECFCICMEVLPSAEKASIINHETWPSFSYPIILFTIIPFSFCYPF